MKAEGTTVPALGLDMASRSDQAMLRSAMSKYQTSLWPLLTDPKIREEIILAQLEALRAARVSGNKRRIDSCVRTLSMLQGQNISETQFQFRHANPEPAIQVQATVTNAGKSPHDTVLDLIKDPDAAKELLRLSEKLNEGQGV